MKKKERSVFLNVWLTLLLAFAVVSFLSNLISIIINISTPPFSRSIFLLYMLAALINFTCIIFLFKWKRWAFYGICIVAFLVFLMNLFLHIGIFIALLGLVAPIILHQAMKSQWNEFT